MFGKRKVVHKSHEELPFADMEGRELHEGDYVESFRYALGYCRILLTDEGYVYESLENGTRVNWARMIDASTKYQKVKKLDKKPT
ncbi:MAG TPA: hypothetical protein ENK25_10365 [Bacteroidetes bacterium]|nr:hypothetical protein [Bacteroidota bacterium]